jgi:hypothetical protein
MQFFTAKYSLSFLFIFTGAVANEMEHVRASKVKFTKVKISVLA